ncbi:MAG: zinc-binding dehydrogenase [Chloroflexi bacterium]|nr:zinc-binding dehydrogenase [Chloroflexota bacterium]
MQFAIQRGAQVLGTASTGKVGFLRQLGVAEVIDYTATRFEDVAPKVDVVLDTIGGEVLARSWEVLKPGGTLVTVAAQLDPDVAPAKGVRGIGVKAQANGKDLTEIARLIDQGRVKAVVSNVFPLGEARRAHELIEGGHALGKIVLRVVE